MTRSESKVRVWYRRLGAASVIAFAAVLLALAAGISPRRLWPVAGFLAVAVGTVGYGRFAGQARKRLMHRLRQGPLPTGVRLRKPLWLHVEQAAVALEFVALVGAIVSAVGYPQVASGFLLVLGGLLGYWYAKFSGPDLTVESAGLRLHFGAAHFLVPWPSIRTVEAIGPDHYQLIRLGIADLDSIRNGVLPDNPSSRTRLRDSFALSRSAIMLTPWTAGVDGQTLQRTIRDGQAGTADRSN